MDKITEGWKRIEAGVYEHPKYGRVWREGRHWVAKPRNSITRHPYRTLRSAIADCWREAH